MRVALWIVGLVLLSSLPVPAGAQGEPLASGQLEIRGSRLTLYSDGVTSDADQTINVAERAHVRTCFGGPSVPCGSLPPGDPRVAVENVQAFGFAVGFPFGSETVAIAPEPWSPVGGFPCGG